jgi:hypothetical protein
MLWPSTKKKWPCRAAARKARSKRSRMPLPRTCLLELRVRSRGLERRAWTPSTTYSAGPRNGTTNAPLNGRRDESVRRGKARSPTSLLGLSVKKLELTAQRARGSMLSP